MIIVNVVATAAVVVLPPAEAAAVVFPVNSDGTILETSAPRSYVPKVIYLALDGPVDTKE